MNNKFYELFNNFNDRIILFEAISKYITTTYTSDNTYNDGQQYMIINILIESLKLYKSIEIEPLSTTTLPSFVILVGNLYNITTDKDQWFKEVCTLFSNEIFVEKLIKDIFNYKDKINDKAIKTLYKKQKDTKRATDIKLYNISSINEKEAIKQINTSLQSLYETIKITKEKKEKELNETTIYTLIEPTYNKYGIEQLIKAIKSFVYENNSVSFTSDNNNRSKIIEFGKDRFTRELLKEAVRISDEVKEDTNKIFISIKALVQIDSIKYALNILLDEDNLDFIVRNIVSYMESDNISDVDDIYLNNINNYYDEIN